MSCDLEATRNQSKSTVRTSLAGVCKGSKQCLFGVCRGSPFGTFVFGSLGLSQRDFSVILTFYLGLSRSVPVHLYLSGVRTYRS